VAGERLARASDVTLDVSLKVVAEFDLLRRRGMVVG
jgi:hypothetical protein